MRVHCTDEIIKSKIRSYQQYKINFPFKPRGFWYGIDNSWVEWCQSEEFDLGSLKYKYSVEFDESKILVINTLEQLDEFHLDYGIPNKSLFTDLKFYNIDWKRLSTEYWGLEISPYFWKRRHEYSWYYSWDVASGCIWNNKTTKVS